MRLLIGSDRRLGSGGGQGHGLGGGGGQRAFGGAQPLAQTPPGGMLPDQGRDQAQQEGHEQQQRQIDVRDQPANQPDRHGRPVPQRKGRRQKGEQAPEQHFQE